MPEVRMTSASTVGLPLLSRISRAFMRSMVAGIVKCSRPRFARKTVLGRGCAADCRRLTKNPARSAGREHNPTEGRPRTVSWPKAGREQSLLTFFLRRDGMFRRVDAVQTLHLVRHTRPHDLHQLRAIVVHVALGGNGLEEMYMHGAAADHERALRHHLARAVDQRRDHCRL